MCKVCRDRFAMKEGKDRRCRCVDDSIDKGPRSNSADFRFGVAMAGLHAWGVNSSKLREWTSNSRGFRGGTLNSRAIHSLIWLSDQLVSVSCTGCHVEGCEQ